MITYDLFESFIESALTDPSDITIREHTISIETAKASLLLSMEHCSVKGSFNINGNDFDLALPMHYFGKCKAKLKGYDCMMYKKSVKLIEDFINEKRN